MFSWERVEVVGLTTTDTVVMSGSVRHCGTREEFPFLLGSLLRNGTHTHTFDLGDIVWRRSDGAISIVEPRG